MQAPDARPSPPARPDDGGAHGEVHRPAPGLTMLLQAIVAINVAMFAFEIGMALKAGSAALTADSIDFLEDAALGALALAGGRLPPRARVRLGAASALILLVPTIAVIPALWLRIVSPVPPAALLISLTACAALATNIGCAALLARHRSTGGSLVRAAFLSARNDVAANLAAIGAGALVAATHSGWPDIAVGVGVGLLNGEAAWDVWRAARREGSTGIAG